MEMKWLECPNCHSTFDHQSYQAVCPNCLASDLFFGLEMQYDYRQVSTLTRENIVHSSRDIWRYVELLPIDSEEHIVSLGEGFTPLTKIKCFEEKGFSGVWYKQESLNPTWSHKDRFNSVAVSKAKELGYKKVTTSSTGNQGLSTAAYASRAGMESIIFFPPETPKVMVDLASHYGALSIITDWNARDMMVRHMVHKDWFPIVSLEDDSLSNPYGIEGYKTIAYEIFSDLGRAPDRVFVPVAGGNALYGIYKGFKELKELELTKNIPQIVACQAMGANALEETFNHKMNEVIIQKDAFSLATSTREKTSGKRALQAVYNSNGIVISATDIEIQQAMIQLAREGFCVEAASAIPIACLNKLVSKGDVDKEESMVCILTSSGVKSPDILADLRKPAVRIEGSTEALKYVLKNHYVKDNTISFY